MKDLKETHKLIVSGNKVEIFSYWLPKDNITVNKKRRAESPSIEEKIRNRENTLKRTSSQIDRLIWANPDLYRFMTLTFAENIKDLKTANRHFNNFIKRLNYHLKDKIKYIAVVEHQKRGAIHYHMMIDRFIEKKTIKEIWSQGHTDIRLIKGSLFKRSRYLRKYLTKTNAKDRRLWGHRCFFTSQNIKKPIIDKTKDMVEIGAFLDSFSFNKKMVSSSEEYIDLDFIGRIIYRKFIFEDVLNDKE
jgi:hypothetical protein